MTSVGDELFVLLYEDDNQLVVCSINNYDLRGRLHLPGLGKSQFNDLTSCEQRTYLYASDHGNSCVRRYDVKGNASGVWPIPHKYKPCGLSLTPSGNLLTTCQEANKLVELSADSGQFVREIALQSDIVNPRHCVQLITGQYVVCHSDKSKHRVCIVDDSGTVTCEYGGEPGSGDGHLDRPRRLAVDDDSQFIFVSDFHNDRVVVLTPNLNPEPVRHMSVEVRFKRKGPYSLHFNRAKRRLFVGEWTWKSGVVVIQL